MAGICNSISHTPAALEATNMAIARKTRTTDDWMALQAAADALGESRLSVLTRIVAGELVGQRIAGRVVVRRDTVHALIATRSQAEALSDVA